jgi:hypothetical protein
MGSVVLVMSAEERARRLERAEERVAELTAAIVEAGEACERLDVEKARRCREIDELRLRRVAVLQQVTALKVARVEHTGG